MSAHEQQILGVIAEVLDRPQIGREDDFFGLNGPSLPARRPLAAHLALRLREVLGLEVPLAALLAHPTAAGLTTWIGSSRFGAAVPPIEHAAAPRELPLSYGQQRLWFLAQLEPGSVTYNMPLSLELAGDLNYPSLEASLRAIERRHDALRTRFGDHSGQPFQWVAPCAGAPLPVIDLSSLPQGWRERLAARLTEEESFEPFDLESGPLWRSQLLRLDASTHRLVLTLHHIVCDGWSIEVLLHELGAHYEVLAAGGVEPALPALPIQYGDYALWQHRYFDREALSGPLAAWKRRLAGHLSVLDLAIDRTSPTVRSAAGGSVSIELPARLLEAAKECSRRQSATLFMALLAVFEILLSRYTGRGELLVGTPVANRTRTELKGLIGFFANTLVLPAKLSPTAPFRELLAHVREVMVAALQYQDLPLQMLVQELAPDRHQSQSPLLQAMFTYHNAPTVLPALPGLALRLVESAGGEAIFDLSLAVVESQGRLRVLLEYRTELLSRPAAHRLLGHFATLLEGAMTGPEQCIDELSLLTDAERHQLLIANSDTAVQAEAVCLHDLFAAQAARSPQATAVEGAREHLTYGELAARVREVAEQLCGLGIGPESTVGVCLRRSPDLIAAILAVLEAGAAYVPLDPTYPAERLAFMLADSGATVVLVDAASLICFPSIAAHTVQLPLDKAQAGGGRAAPLCPAEPGNLAYVIYTSGSTGHPKGVAIEHASAAAFVRWAGEVFGAELGAGVLASTSICFDLSVFEIFATLCHGGRVILTENALELVSRPEIDEVGLINTVPSAFAELLRMGAVPRSVRTVNLAGEALSGRLARQIYDDTAVERVFNLYGPSEDTTYSLFAQVGRSDPTPPIGRPVTGTRTCVLGPLGELLPAGVPGELLLGGAGLARGYLGRPDLTAERFVPDPWAPEPGERLYRTGDLVRFRWDGELEFLGRIDHQVKVRGFRIELEEVEAALSALPEVVAAAVGVRGEQDGQRLVAWVVLAEDGVDAPRLRAGLASCLPEYMVPSVWTMIGELPQTPNGKVDRKALPAPEWQSAAEATVAPRTPVEEILAGIWAELLGLDRVGADGHFFALGGHSLLATRVVSRLRAAFGIELPLRELFDAPVLAELAAKVDAALRAGTGRHAPPLLPAAPTLRAAPMPLSFAQQRLWFIDQLEPGSSLYNIPVALRATGPLDAAVLALCLGEVIRRHEALRTVFAAPQGEPVQVIQRPAPFALPAVDLAGLPPHRREEVARLLAGEEAAHPFDLARGPMLRAILLRLAAEDHLFALTLHHIVSDGWSMGLLVREVAALYAAFSEGRPSPLPELPVQYADFAVWQHSWLHGEVLEREVTYWRRQLAGLPPLLELPTDRPRTAAQSYRGARRPVRLPAGLVRHLQNLGRREGATLFMVLLAGFQSLLTRHSGKDDLAVGSPIAGRNRVEIEGLIGVFVNTLVLRGDLSGAPSFRELLGQVRETALAAWLHQDAPFEKLVEELSPERSRAHSPLFQVMFVLQNAPFEKLEVESVHLRPMSAAGSTVKFDLELDLREQDGELSGTVGYGTDLFDGATIDRLVGHLVRLLEGAVDDPDRRSRDLPLFASGEAHQLWAEWNDTAWPAAPAAPGVVERFEAQVRHSPQSVAVVGARERLTYGELAALAHGIARRLRALGMGPESTVGVCVHRSPVLIAAILGVLESGAAYVPLDPTYPAERLTFMLADSGATVVLADATSLPRDLEDGVRVVRLPLDFTQPDDDTSSPHSRTRPGNLAYLIYTSGSTGRPKGVAIEHASAAAFVRWAGEVFSAELPGGVLASTSVCFDLSVFEIFAPLCHGGRVILVENALELAARPEIDEIGLINTVPSVFAELLRLGAVPRSVRTVNLAGESLPGWLVRQIYDNTTVERVFNLYGPSEDTTYSLFAQVDPDDPAPPIGRPVTGTRAFVLGPRGELLPTGVAGELLLGGAGLARGYLGRPDLTAERFVPDPWTLEPGARLYRTGDLVRWLPDGRLNFLGRIDQQVKVRGFRIELGEIEEALSAMPGVRKAAVAVRGDGPAAGLVAWAVPDEGQSLVPAELRRALRERLPDYMVPGNWRILPILPLLPNGKVDRRALSDLGDHQDGTGESFEVWTELEQAVAGICGEVLCREQIDRNADFFELGGHSLLATQLVSRIRHIFDIELPLRAFFEAPTVAEVARWIERSRAAGLGPKAPPIVPVLRDRDLPLSFAQERLWFLDRLVPDNPSYNIPWAVRLTGILDVLALRRTFAKIVCRHESLRTTFRSWEGRPPVQIITPPPAEALPLVELGGLPPEGARGELRRLAVEERMRTFDLARGPLFRALLVRLDPEEHTLLVSLHHVIADGWSGSILHREMVALYSAFVAGASPPLPELPVQYADFAIWQRQWLQGDALREQLDYWEHQLTDLPELLDLPSDYPRPAVERFRGATASARLPALLVRDLGPLARRCGATLSMSVLAGFSALLARVARRDDLPVGMAIANRTRREIEGLIGFFVNTLVLRNRIPLGTGEEAGFPSFLGALRETALDAFTHQDLPFEKLVEELHPERDLGHNPLIQVMFSWQSFPRSQAQIQGLTLSPLEGRAGSTGTSKFDLTLFLHEQEGEILEILEYNSDLFEAVTAQRLLGHLETLLVTAVAAPELPIAELPLLSAAERQQFVREWNFSASFPAEKSLSKLFEAQVWRAPNAPALSFEGRPLSYAELNRSANRLAHFLRDLGVGPESRVGLCVGRSPELAIGILGILKAGAAYVPLDPDYPRERLAFLIRDAGPKVLVSEKCALEALPELPAGGPEVVLLDAHREALEACPTDDPTPDADGNEIAYVIYTSGSTGHPKGVLVTHAAVVRLLRATEPLFSFGADDVWTLFHSYAFDFSVWEMWGALAYGGCLVVVPYEVSRSPEEFCDLLERERVTVLNQTPSAFRQLLAADAVRPRDLALRWVIFGGEALDPHSLAPWTARRGDRRPRLVNMYGITETTVHVTWRPLVGSDTAASGSPIGRPLLDLEAHVLDSCGQPASIGVPGEIFVAGAGLARGYLNRPALTAERFLPDPFSGRPGARLYRTGDLARRLSDGQLEHLGRIDHQVKVRGFRIEPEEIEAVLREHSAVHDAVVLARGDSMDDQRLVAYVVQAPKQIAGGNHARDEQVSQWAMVFDDTYRKDARKADPTFNIIGWDSTYTGEPIPRDEMAEWLEDTVERIRTLPLGRVLEIGCGTGLLLFRITPESESYVGTDLSREAIAYVQGHLGQLADPGKVRLLTRPANRFDDFAPDSFDTLLLNSVAQYFPSLDYLLEVLTEAVEVVRPGGAIFLGDLRSLPLLETFHTSVELFRAEPDLPLTRLRQRVQLRRQLENELVVSPALFTALQQRLPKIGCVEVHPKRGRAHNELTGFRYQVVLRLGETPPAEEIPWLDWRREGLTLEAVRSRLERKTDGVLALRDVPNARVSAAAAAVRLLREDESATAGELRQGAALAAVGAVDPQVLWDLGNEFGWEVELGWASHGSGGSFDAVLRRHDRSRKPAPLAFLLSSALPGSVSRAWNSYGNHPMQGRFARRMAPELRIFLSSRLPDYMVPAAFVLLDQLPLTAHGKVDRQQLPEPELTRQCNDVSYVPPRTATEERLAAIYAELLGVDRVGADDDFFVLGGHSLLATQVISRVRHELAIELPLRTLFEQSTVAGFAAAVDALGDLPTGPQAPPILPVPRCGEIPLSFAQERLWFLDQLAPEMGSFNIAAALRLEGLLDTTALEAALGEIERRHEILRTTFPTRADVPVQVISPVAGLHLPRIDLSGLPASRRETERGLLAWEEARIPFDLALGPVWRTTLVRLEPADHALLLTLHHIASDAWSLSILVREVSVLYAAFSQGLPSPLPELPVQFADYAAWQRRWLDGKALAPELTYWRERLAGAPVLILPTDLPHRPEQPIKPACLPVVVEPELTHGLSALARAASATLFMATLSVFQAVLALHTGRYDIVTGSNVANRNRLETEKLIGCFINVFVLRTDLSGDPTFEELLQRVREVTLGASAHQNLPFERLVQELEPSRTVARTPLFQVKVDLLPAAPPAELSALCLSELDTGRIVARYDLHLSLQEEDGRLRGGLLYDAGRFTAATVDHLRTHFGLLLAEAVRTPGARLSEIGQRLEAAKAAEEQERRQALGRANLASLRHVKRRSGAMLDLSVEAET